MTDLNSCLERVLTELYANTEKVERLIKALGHFEKNGATTQGPDTNVRRERKEARKITMPDFIKIIKELEAERDHLNEAIEAIRALAANKPRRGRPPKWMAQAKASTRNTTGKKRGRPRKRPTAGAETVSTAVAAAGH